MNRIYSRTVRSAELNQKTSDNDFGREVLPAHAKCVSQAPNKQRSLVRENWLSLLFFPVLAMVIATASPSHAQNNWSVNIDQTKANGQPWDGTNGEITKATGCAAFGAAVGTSITGSVASSLVCSLLVSPNVGIPNEVNYMSSPDPCVCLVLPGGPFCEDQCKDPGALRKNMRGFDWSIPFSAISSLRPSAGRVEQEIFGVIILDMDVHKNDVIGAAIFGPDHFFERISVGKRLTDDGVDPINEEEWLSVESFDLLRAYENMLLQGLNDRGMSVDTLSSGPVSLRDRIQPSCLVGGGCLVGTSVIRAR